LVISGRWVRACGSLNPSSSSLKAIIFRARGSLICNIFINSSSDAVLIYMVGTSSFVGVREVGKKSSLAISYNF